MSEGVRDCKKFGNHCITPFFCPLNPPTAFKISTPNQPKNVQFGPE